MAKKNYPVLAEGTVGNGGAGERVAGVGHGSG